MTESLSSDLAADHCKSKETTRRNNNVNGNAGREKRSIVEASYLRYVDLINIDVTLRPNINDESFQRYLVSLNSNIEAFDILSKEYFQGLYLVRIKISIKLYVR